MMYLKVNACLLENRCHGSRDAASAIVKRARASNLLEDLQLRIRCDLFHLDTHWQTRDPRKGLLRGHPVRFARSPQVAEGHHNACVEVALRHKLRWTSVIRSMCWIETGHASMQARQLVQDQLVIAGMMSSICACQPAKPVPAPSRNEIMS